MGSTREGRTWVNLAMASILTLSPFGGLPPVESVGRRRGTTAETISEWFILAEDTLINFSFPGGLIIPAPNRKILFTKVLGLGGLQKRKPFVKL